MTLFSHHLWCLFFVAGFGLAAQAQPIDDLDAVFREFRSQLDEIHKRLAEHEAKANPIYADMGRLEKAKQKAWSDFRAAPMLLAEIVEEAAERHRRTLRDIRRLSPEYRQTRDKHLLIYDDINLEKRKLLRHLNPLSRDGREAKKIEHLKKVVADYERRIDLLELKSWIAMLLLVDGNPNGAIAHLDDVKQRMEDKTWFVIFNAKNIAQPPPYPHVICDSYLLYMRAMVFLDRKKEAAAVGNALDNFPNLRKNWPWIDDVINTSKASVAAIGRNWRPAVAALQKVNNDQPQQHGLGRPIEKGGHYSAWMDAEAVWLMAAGLPMEEEKVDGLIQRAFGVYGEDSCWPALRAKAALSAAKGEWEEAIKYLDRAQEVLPGVLWEELQSQRNDYQRQVLFVLPEPEP